MAPPSTDPAPLLARLIAIRTDQPRADERPLARALHGLLAEHAPDELVLEEVPRTDGHGAYVYARWGEPTLLLNAHLDTVPPNDGWSSDPFTPSIDQERVWGLGACDTKGGIAAILAALSSLAALDGRRPHDLAVLLSGDEEHGGTVMRAFLDGAHGHDLVRAAARAIVFEPTSCRAGTRHRGIITVEARRAGVGGHSSRADHQPAPLADLARVAAAWADWGITQRDVGPEGFQGLCLNIARFDGGIAFNVIPEAATLSASLRPPPGVDTAAARDTLTAIARRVAPEVTLSFSLDNPSFSTKSLARFADFAPATSGAIDLAYWTEAALLSERGVDAIVYGPGDIAHAHAANEFVPRRDLEAARDAIISLIRARSE